MIRAARVLAPRRGRGSTPAKRDLVAPFRGQGRAYEGHRPWERHQVEICIPVIDPSDELTLVIELLRAQTVPPYIVLVDTGSQPEGWAALQTLRAPDLEVHAIWSGGLQHSAAVVAAALDLGMSLCRQDRLLFSHSDAFLRRPDAVEILCQWLSPECPAVGYGMTPRGADIPDWRRMMGHVWCGLYMPAIRTAQARWAFHPCDAEKHENWDTEVSFNRYLAKAGIWPVILGPEENWTRNINEDYDHVRSFPLSSLYLPEHHERAKGWMRDAKREARQRLDLWKTPAQ